MKIKARYNSLDSNVVEMYNDQDDFMCVVYEDLLPNSVRSCLQNQHICSPEFIMCEFLEESEVSAIPIGQIPVEAIKISLLSIKKLMNVHEKGHCMITRQGFVEDIEGFLELVER